MKLPDSLWQMRLKMHNTIVKMIALLMITPFLYDLNVDSLCACPVLPLIRKSGNGLRFNLLGIERSIARSFLIRLLFKPGVEGLISLKI